LVTNEEKVLLDHRIGAIKSRATLEAAGEQGKPRRATSDSRCRDGRFRG
jgi:hypothetical protein